MKIKKLGAFFSIIALGFVVWYLNTNVARVDWKNLDINIRFICLAAIAFVLYFVFRNISWIMMVRRYDVQLSLQDGMWYLSRSELLRYIPGNIWGLGARVVSGPKFGIKKVNATVQLLEDALLLISSSSLIALLFLPFAQLDIPMKILLLVLLIILLISPWYARLFFLKLVEIISKFLNKSLPSGASLAPLRSLGITYVIYCVSWIWFAVAHMLLFSAFFETSSIFTIGLFSLLAWIIGYCSLVTPMGLGVREGIITLGASIIIPASLAAIGALSARLLLAVVEMTFLGFTALFFYLQKQTKADDNSSYYENHK